MKKENESNGFLGFMNVLYFIFVGLVFIGIFLSITNLPEDSGVIKLSILLIGLIQILVLINLIILNKGNSDEKEKNPNITDGLFEEFYDNGNIKTRGNYLNGKEDGIWESFYYDGSLNKSQTYKDGIQIS
jgi:hypothetical protein